MLRRLGTTLIGLALILTTASGCGPDDDDSGSGDGSTPTTQADAADASTDDVLPDFWVKRLQVTGVVGDDGHSHWSFNLVVTNEGGTSGMYHEDGELIVEEIPILFTADFPEDKPAACLHEGQDFAGLRETRWVAVPLSGNQFAFSEVFRVIDLPAHDCVPSRLTVQFDMLLPNYISTVTESSERNNLRSVFVEDWPSTNTWTSETL